MDNIDILRNSTCKIILNGKNIGNYICYQKEKTSDEINIFAQEVTKIENENIEVVIKEVDKKILQSDKVELIIYQRDGEKYYKSDIPDCRLEEYNVNYKDYVAIIADLHIEKITKEEYDMLNSSEINWDKIKVTEGKSKDDMFEELCQDIIRKIKEPSEGIFHCNAADGGRDWQWEWPWLEGEEKFIKMPNLVAIMQCKYSENCRKISKTEIWNELVKCIEYFPDDYFFVTNREITADVRMWWDDISEELYTHSKTKYIPFRLHLIDRYDLESLIDKYYDIKKKYF